MSITLHCESCKKKIIAPDDAGGKWGRCPYCKHKCYIPMADDRLEGLTLSPVDENEETKYKQMMRETYNITEELLHETALPEDIDGTAEIDANVLAVRVIKYLRQMADGKLDDAHFTADKIVPYRKQSKKILESMLVSSMPAAELNDVPEKVLNGFIKNLLTRMS